MKYENTVILKVIKYCLYIYINTFLQDNKPLYGRHDIFPLTDNTNTRHVPFKY